MNIQTLTVVSAIFVLFGLFTMFFASEIVGGAAYNYIIAAGRGTGLICVGIVAAVLANAYK